MKIHHWVIWAIASIVLLVGLPRPWYFIGFLSFAVWLLCFGLTTTSKQGDPWHRTQRLIYKALDENESVHYQELIRISQLPPWVVKLVLRKWKKQNLVREDRELFNLTLAGLQKLKEQYDEA